MRNEKEGENSDEYTSQSKTITHFHYVAWPDFGVPETPDEFAKFFDLLHEHKCFTDPARPRCVFFAEKVAKGDQVDFLKNSKIRLGHP